MLRWLAGALGRLARAISAPPTAPQSLFDMRRELVSVLRAVAVQDAQCEAASERLGELRKSAGAGFLASEIRETERLGEQFSDDLAEGLGVLDAAMARFAGLRSTAEAQGFSTYGLELPVWDDALRREARAYVAEHLDLESGVLAQADHEAFVSRLSAAT